MLSWPAVGSSFAKARSSVLLGPEEFGRHRPNTPRSRHRPPSSASDDEASPARISYNKIAQVE